MMRPILLLLFAATAVSLSGQNLLTGEKIWDSDQVRVVDTGREPGQKAFSLAIPAQTVMTRPIPVDCTKRYRLSGYLKSASAEKPSTSCFGLAMQDARGLNIMQSNVNVVAGSDTALAADAAKGDEKIIVKDASNWEKRRSIRTLAVFNIKPDYTDLPNFALTGLIDRVRKSAEGDTYEITLKAPLNKAYPTGTPVRQHLYGALLNCCAAYSRTPGEWTKYTAEIGGLAPSGAPADRFWAGTKTVRILIMSDAGRTGAELLFSDIVFEEIKE